MARIAGVDLPRTKRVETGLQYIYGIGPHRSSKILAEVKIDPNVRVKDLSEEEVSRIAKAIEAQGAVEGDLRKQVSLDIKRLIEIGSHRGSRHRRNLPVRGQRTKTNARTRKGPRKGARKITITDAAGNVIAWSSSGSLGFKGSRKGTPFAAQQAATTAATNAKDHGLKSVDVRIQGPGSGRESAIRAFTAVGVEVKSIRDITPIPHNGCRPPKRRRV